jgi:4-amino-4-deoxy-L-arabinose transferase-like glycosyltransferase
VALTAPTASRAAAARSAAVTGAGPAAVLVLAAALRLVNLGAARPDPFYDAAVRSMGTSWHALLVGAFEPGARVAIDKPPVDLWLQVASTRLLGFTTPALILPAAAGGVLCVVFLHDALRTLFGRPAALAGALALAVLPIAVITDRSDTMDSVMAAAATGAAALTARAARSGSRLTIAAAGAAIGLAFELKLFEGLVAAPALAAMWWLGAGGSRLHRATGLAAAGAALTTVAVAWLVAVSLLPLGSRPFALGASNGSPWRAAFVYDGLDRLRGRVRLQPPTAEGRAHAPAPPGPLRLLSPRVSLLGRVGAELAAAVAALTVALAAGAWRRLDRAGRAGLAALAVWLACGAVLCSAMRDLHPRYADAFAPAIAGCLGAGVVLAAGGRRRRIRAAATCALAAALAVPLAVSVRAVARATTDSGRPGWTAPSRVEALSRYLRPRDAGARDEVAAVAPSKAAQLIARDGRPVLVLASVDGRPLVTARALAAEVRRGAVRYAVLGDACSRPGTPACAPGARWVRAHGTDVSRPAGQRRGYLYRLGRRTPRSARARTSSRSRTAAPPPRRRGAAGPSARRRARRRPR